MICLVNISIYLFANKGLQIERYRQEALAQHNMYRAQCNAEALQQNTTLDTKAQLWCEKLASSDQFTHSGTIEYGENSYKKTPFDFNNDNGFVRIKKFNRKLFCLF